MKKWIALFLCLCCIAACLTAIFMQSVKTQENSNAASLSLTAKLQPILDPHGRMDPELFNHRLRKVAHAIEFGILGLTLGIFFLLIEKIAKKRFYSCPLLFSLMAAVTDEWIQAYTERGSQVSDVGIDFVGAAAGLLAVWSIAGLVRLIKKCER